MKHFYISNILQVAKNGLGNKFHLLNNETSCHMPVKHNVLYALIGICRHRCSAGRIIHAVVLTHPRSSKPFLRCMK